MNGSPLAPMTSERIGIAEQAKRATSRGYPRDHACARRAAEARPSGTPLARGEELSQGATSRELLDDVLGLEILELAGGQAEPLGIDRGIVLAEQRGAVHRDVRVGHLDR